MKKTKNKKEAYIFFTMLVTVIIMLSNHCVMYTNSAIKNGQALYSTSTYDKNEKLEFDKDGNLVMTTYDKTATSNVTYQTIGWTIKRSQGSVSGNESIRIKLTASAASKVDPNNSAYEYHYFQCTKETIFNQIEHGSQEWMHELYTNGGTVYLDAIMTVCEGGVPKGGMTADGKVYGEVYFTYDGIAGARNWADKQSLRSHFNKSVDFPPNVKLLYGTYEVHYMELTEGSDQDAFSLGYLGYDKGKTKLKKEMIQFTPENLSGEHLKYIKTKIIYKKHTKSMKSIYTNGGYTVDNSSLIYSYVKVFHYFKREQTEETEEHTIQYGNDFIHFVNRLKISAEDKDDPKFDVEKGIPTSEKIRVDGVAQKFAYELTYINHTGFQIVPVKARILYRLQNEEYPQGSEILTKIQTYYVKRDYSYYTIERYKIWYLDSVIARNYSFAENEIVWKDFYSPNVNVEMDQESYITIPESSVTINVGMLQNEEQLNMLAVQIQMAVENNGAQLQVMNDTFMIDGEKIMTEGPFDTEADPPKMLSDAHPVSFEDENLPIINAKQNGTWESQAEAVYCLYGEGQSISYEIYHVNPVVIHTPVICQADTSNEISFNQQIHPTSDNSLILGRDFQIQLSTTGLHQEYPGYGKRDYNKYTKYRQVRFPFPVYYKEQYIAENQWINLEKETESFYLPIGVDEGGYYVQFRALALNYESVGGGSARTEQNANLSIENYAAVDQAAVTVVGRMYGMEITDVIDRPRWTNVFYQTYAGGVVPTGRTYRIGDRNCNGVPLENWSEQFVFPILGGSHPYNKMAGSVRLGYRIKFRLKTIGNMRGENDQIVLKPAYYYVHKNTKERKRVDLYTKKELQKISQKLVLEPADRIYQAVTQKNVDSLERQQSSLQIWHGEYSLPPDIYFVPYGTDMKSYVSSKGGRIRQDDPLFLQDGYLIVQFQIQSVSNQKLHLDYVNVENNGRAYCNMWKTEGFFYERVDNRGCVWKFSDGDMFVFDTKRTMYDDYHSVGTH